ncbi:8097_t:CDS:2, partial [Entrophospora sp. SA101]
NFITDITVQPEEFKDISNYVKYFQHYVKICHDKSEDTCMFYLSVIQSSGYGNQDSLRNIQMMFTFHI